MGEVEGEVKWVEGDRDEVDEMEEDRDEVGLWNGGEECPGGVGIEW